MVVWKDNIQLSNTHYQSPITGAFYFVKRAFCYLLHSNRIQTSIITRLESILSDPTINTHKYVSDIDLPNANYSHVWTCLYVFIEWIYWTGIHVLLFIINCLCILAQLLLIGLSVYLASLLGCWLAICTGWYILVGYL